MHIPELNAHISNDSWKDVHRIVARTGSGKCVKLLVHFMEAFQIVAVAREGVSENRDQLAYRRLVQGLPARVWCGICRDYPSHRISYIRVRELFPTRMQWGSRRALYCTSPGLEGDKGIHWESVLMLLLHGCWNKKKKKEKRIIEKIGICEMPICCWGRTT